MPSENPSRRAEPGGFTGGRWWDVSDDEDGISCAGIGCKSVLSRNLFGSGYVGEEDVLSREGFLSRSKSWETGHWRIRAAWPSICKS